MSDLDPSQYERSPNEPSISREELSLQFRLDGFVNTSYLRFLEAFVSYQWDDADFTARVDLAEWLLGRQLRPGELDEDNRVGQTFNWPSILAVNALYTVAYDEIIS